MNIKDIAKLCQTSVATVSRVINDDPKVASSTRQKVLAVIKEHNFVPNSTGRNLRTQKSKKILVLLPTMANQFYSRILMGVEAKAEEYGYEILVGITNLEESQELKYLDMLRTKHVDGCISFFNTIEPEKVSNLSIKFPFVQCCEPTLGAEVSSVVVDNRQAIYDVTTEFIKKGHKHIGMISGDYYKYSELSRERGYKEALRDNGIDFDESLLVRSFYRFKDGAKSLKELMEADHKPTAVICVSDSLAIGAITEMRKMGIEAGKDVEIIGFDNTSITEHYYPTISSIAQPRFELGEEAFELLYKKLENNESSNKKIVLPYKIIHRASTKARKK